MTVDCLTPNDEETTMLKTRPFGTTGIEVSEIGLGAWQLGRSAAWPDGPDGAEAVRLVHAALEAGVTFIDTAPGYADGQSEPNIGKALAGGRRDGVVLCTKFGHTPEGGTDWAAAAIESSVRGSAERLRTDHLDVVLLHNPPADVLDSAEHYDVLQRLTDSGLVRAFGASVDAGADVDTVLTATASTALEVRLSALYQEPAPAMCRARDKGVGTIVKVPLESGWLSGRYSADSVFTDVRARWSREDVALRAGLVDELRNLLPAGVGLLAASLGFLLADDSGSTVIPGTRSLEQLHSTVAAVAEAVPAAVAGQIREWYAARLVVKPLDW